MLHDPSTIALGNAKDMEKAITTLNEVKESIINAYAAKTGLSHNRISKLMSDETWINAKRAVELGFADEILFDDKKPEADEPDEETDNPDEEGGDEDGNEEETQPEKEQEKKPLKLTADALWQYSTRIMGQTILDRPGAFIEGADNSPPAQPDTQESSKEGMNTPVIGMDGRTADGSVPYEILKQQLVFLK